MKMPKTGKVEKYVHEKIGSDGAILSILIDPVDYPSPKEAIKTAAEAYEGGADIIAVGGSIGAQGELLDYVTREINDNVDVPIALFPGNIATVTRYADAIYFMSLLNSRNPYWISGAQTLAAPVIKHMDIETLPIGYIVVEPGGTVGWVGDVNMIPRKKPSIAAATAMAGELMGNRFIFTDAGSASSMGHIPLEMVEAISKSIDVPYMVAGGIRTPKEAGSIVKAGGDWLQIGTAVQGKQKVLGKTKSLVKEIKKQGKKRV